MARFHATSPGSEAPSLARVASTLMPVLRSGLPINDDNEAERALADLGELLGWKHTSLADRRATANQLLGSLLDAFADDQLVKAASLLFRSAGELTARRTAAARALGMEVEQFTVEIEPSIINILCWQLIQREWQKVVSTDIGAKRRRRDSIAFSLAFILLVLSATSGWLKGWLGSSVEGWARLAIGVAVVLAAIVLFLYRKVTRTSESDRDISQSRPIVPYADPNFLADCQKEAAKRLNESRVAVPLLVEMILIPSEYRMRTVENISLSGRSINQSVSIEFAFSDARSLVTSLDARAASEEKPTGAQATVRDDPSRERPKFLYVPVLIPPKGELIDRMRITTRDGSTASSLSHTQSLRVVALGLRYLLVWALMNADTKPGDFDRSEFLAAEFLLLQLIARRGPVGHDGDLWAKLKKDVSAALADLNEIFTNASDPVLSGRQTRLRYVEDYVLKLISSYPIIVSLPFEDQPRRRLNYERVIIPKPVLHSWPDRLRLWFGLRPSRVIVPVTLAFRTDSYHLELVGPVNYYVRTQLLGCRKCSQRLESSWRGLRSNSSGCHHAPIGTDERCYVRLRSRVGQNYSHVYMRGFGSSKLDEDDIIMSAQFAEAPPGVEERALLAATAAVIVIGFIGYLQGVLRPSVLPTDAPAVLLSLPGFAATWFGFESDADTVLRSSLTARVSLLSTGILSLVGVACYLLEAHLAWRLPKHLDLLGVHEDIWWALLLFGLINVAVIARRSLWRTRRFVQLSGRSLRGGA